MRRKKHKNTRRTVKFFKIHHAFREPYKVLMDGNFVHAMLITNMKEVTQLISSLLGGQVRLFTTRCCQQELKALGADFSDSLAASRKLHLFKCSHEDHPVAAADCLQSLVGTDNAGHFFVGTQDRQLRGHLGAMPAGPVLFVAADGLHLEQPTPQQQQWAEQAASSAAVPVPCLQTQSQVGQPGRHEQASEAVQQAAEAFKARAQQEAANTSIYSHKRKAKGPNPLSVKKKQLKLKPHVSSSKELTGEAAPSDPAIKRMKRKKKAAA